MAKIPHILVVDDERAIRNTLKEILEFEGYHIATAESGFKCLELIQKHNFDLLFLDIKMKGMDGLETLKEIRNIGQSMPVIMISGHGTIEIAVEATKFGAFDFLEKPPDLNRLLIATRNALCIAPAQYVVMLSFIREQQSATYAHKRHADITLTSTIDRIVVDCNINLSES